MFTGLVEATGAVLRKESAGSGRAIKLSIDASGFSDFDCKLGDSIAVNGCCLTVASFFPKQEKGVVFDVSSETLHRTNLGKLERGHVVNLERAARLSDRIGGHLVSGHIDGLARFHSLKKDDNASLLEIVVPRMMGRYCVSKGSACIDGISLTINGVEDSENETKLSFMIIPTTLQKTTLGTLSRGWEFNFEIDLIAKLVERIRSH